MVSDKIWSVRTKDFHLKENAKQKKNGFPRDVERTVDDFDKNKKKIKECTKIKSLTVHLLLFSFIILVTFHTIFASFYFAQFQYFHDIV